MHDESVAVGKDYLSLVDKCSIETCLQIYHGSPLHLFPVLLPTGAITVSTAKLLQVEHIVGPEARRTLKVVSDRPVCCGRWSTIAVDSDGGR